MFLNINKNKFSVSFLKVETLKNNVEILIKYPSIPYFIAFLFL